MKRFYKKKNIIINKLIIIIIFTFITTFILFKIINKSLNEKITYIAEVKIEELTRYYLNQTIKKYLNINTNNYIKTNIINDEIISIDIDNYETNKLLNSFLNELENSLKEIETGNINKYHNLEFIYGNNGIIILVPFGVTFNTSLLSSFGPNIPIKVSFIENIEMYIDVNVSNYGINNSLIKLYLNINIKEKIDFPVSKNTQNISYKFLLSSKIINGNVPSLYGDSLNKNSNIINN